MPNDNWLIMGSMNLTKADLGVVSNYKTKSTFDEIPYMIYEGREITNVEQIPAGFGYIITINVDGKK